MKSNLIDIHLLKFLSLSFSLNLLGTNMYRDHCIQIIDQRLSRPTKRLSSSRSILSTHVSVIKLLGAISLFHYIEGIG